MTMHEIDLTRVDLNLLTVFEALYRERSVGRAATRLSLSQSATSHALGRLRQLFDDPVFVRHPRGIEPTPRCRELADPILAVLADLRSALGIGKRFDPASLDKRFRISAHDYALALVIPPLLACLRKEAPRVELKCVSVHPAEVIGHLDRGDLDFALGGFVGIEAARVTRTKLFSDRFVGVARQGHASVRKGKMTLRTFLDLPQVMVAPGGESRGDIDETLEALGHRRHIVATSPTFLALPYMVANTELIGVLPERLARMANPGTPLTLFELPFDMQPMTCNLLALAPMMDTAETRWMAGLLGAIGKDLQDSVAANASTR